MGAVRAVPFTAEGGVMFDGGSLLGWILGLTVLACCYIGAVRIDASTDTEVE